MSRERVRVDPEKLQPKRRRGRPPGSINGQSRVSIMELLKIGDLPADVMARWGIQGWAEMVRIVDGMVVSEKVALDFWQRLACLTRSAKFYSPELTPREVQPHMHQLEAQKLRDSEWVIADHSRDLDIKVIGGPAKGA